MMVSPDDKNTPLHHSASAGYVELSRLLIQNGADMNCQNVNLDTPLLLASENGHIEIAKLLLEMGLEYRFKYAFDISFTK